MGKYKSELMGVVGGGLFGAIAILASSLALEACKTTSDSDSETQSAANGELGQPITPDPAVPEPMEKPKPGERFSCTNKEKDKAFDIQYDVLSGRPKIDLKFKIPTSNGEVPIGLYQAADGSNSDAEAGVECIELFVDVSENIKIPGTTYAGMITSNCQDGSTTAWALKVFVRKNDVYEATMVYEEPFSCSRQ